MAADPNDLFAEFRTGGAPAPASAPASPVNPDGTVRAAEGPAQDIFNEFRVSQQAPDIRREDNTLGEEFRAGLGGGIDSLQGSLFGVAGLAGRELGINWLEDAGNKGAAEQFEQAADATRQAQGFTDIDSAGGFFRWTAASLGEAIPSLAAAMSGGGIGAIAGKKAVELGVKKSVARRVERDLRSRMGFSTAEALESTRGLMNTPTGQAMIRDAFVRGKRVIDPALAKASKVGSGAGAVAVSALPQIGQIDQELINSGVADPGLTALIGGIAGGALEAVPALRLLDKMFPGVDKQVSKQFVKDFAVSTGTQLALEGSTEAAQEIIALAALAYKDPTFDMFSPDAKKRVVDAFAAGALVGAVTGAGAEGIGAVQSGAFSGVKAAVPAIGAWSMTAKDAATSAVDKAKEGLGRAEQAIEDQLPEGFVEADNTLFQEVKGRVYATVQPHVEAAVNSLQDQVDKITLALNDSLEGGVNVESAKISEVAKAAHEKFLKDHGDQIDKAKKYMDDQIKRITQAAKEIKDPEARAKYVQDQVDGVKERLSGFVDMIRRKAAERDQRTEAEVDNMDFDDDLMDQLGIQIEEEETERRVGPSGRKFDRSVGPAVQQESSLSAPKGETVQTGETESEPVIVWGRNQLAPKVGVSGKEEVVGYKTKADAEKGRAKLKQRFLRSRKRRDSRKQDDMFRIKKNEQGSGWVIEAIDPDMRDAQKFYNDLESSRDSAKRVKDTPRSLKRKFKFPIDGKKFGFANTMKSMTVDLMSMAFKGRNLDPNAKTMEDGFLAFATEMLTRDLIDVPTFNAMNEQFQEHFGETKDVAIDEFASPAKFPTEGVAKANMINFINKMKERGIKIPFNMLNTVQNDDGSFSWGIDDVRTFRVLRQKSPENAKTILTEIKKERRQDQLADASRDANEFSGNAVGLGAGDLADTRGSTAGTARVSTDPIRTGRTGEGERTATRTKTGGRGDPLFEGSDIGQSAAALVDETPGEDDITTKGQGKNQARTEDRRGNLSREDERGSPLESEFETRHKSQVKGQEPGLDKIETRKRNNAEELSKRDQAILKRWGAKGSVKLLLDGSVITGTQKLVSDLANFVTKTLGLSNQIVVVDDVGLSILIENGMVTDPIFEQTLNDPNVHARNIRINDNSFVYLSPKILSDPVATTLAFGHEMGHHVYRVAWDKLTPEGKDQLRRAYMADRRTDAKDVFEGKLGSIDEDFDEAGFNEWMADQLAAWITQRRAPANKVEGFFAKVGAQIRKLYDFIKKNDRFQLNQTFAEFADAVALRATRTGDQSASPFNDAIMKAWFRNEGVTMYKWFGDAMQGKDKGPKPKKPSKTFQPHTAGELADMIYRRELEMENLWEEQEATNATPERAKEIRKRLNELEADIASIAEDMQKIANARPKEADGVNTGAEVDNMAFDFTPVTQEGKDALARIEKKYPAIVKRAVTLRNWVVAAYKMALAPSTSAVRDIAKRVKVAGELVTIFNRQAHGDKKVRQNYHQAVELMRGQFMKQYTDITKSIENEIKKRRPDIKNRELQVLVNAKMREIGKSLQKKDSDPSATFTPEEQAVRTLFDAAHDYAREAGLPVRKVTNYFPRQLSRELLIANKQKILDHLTKDTPKKTGMSLTKARALYNSLIDPNANDGRATFDATETPGFKAMNSRHVQDKFFDQFLDDNTDGIVANYVNQVVKRAEFNRLLGEPMPATEMDAREAQKKGLWDPKGKMHEILNKAKEEGATDEELVILEKYIDANLGQLGRDDIKPGMRKFMAGVMAYQNMRVLLFTVFASLPDLAGPAIRSGSMKNAFKSVKNHIADAAKTDGDLADMAHALGIIQDTASEHIMTEYVDNHYMPPTLRKWNDQFFKWTGLNWYTDFTRKAALAVGIDYLENSYNDFLSSDSKKSARGKDMLAELGLEPKHVAKWLRDGKPTYNSVSHDMESANRKIGEALVQFVDESIMRPNASQRPILASHPGAMLVYHLKGYLYAVHDITLKRIKFNIDESESPAQYAAAIAPALAMMLLTAVGLELREMIQYRGSNRKPPTDRMDGWEYTWELAQRSGLTGIAQIGIDFEGAEDRGMSHVAGIGGPALSQAADIISKPSTQTIPKAIPVIGQIPAARDMVRKAL